MNEISVTAYAGHCPMCGISQRALDKTHVDIICKSCSSYAQEIYETFFIDKTALRFKPISIKNEFILHTTAKSIICRHPHTHNKYKMSLPAGVKEIELLD